jgi:hypothetical protein
MAIHGQDSFTKSLDETFQALDFCLGKRLLQPTLLLAFSIMDAFSWIEFSKVSNPKDRFEDWVNKWMLPHEQVICGAADLYANRSAVLHRFGTESRLVENKQALRVSYCHGDAPFEGLEMIRNAYFEATGNDLGIVKLESLVESLKKGVANFLEYAHANDELKLQMEKYFSSEQPFRFHYANKR